jgi:hypothetical protein
MSTLVYQITMQTGFALSADGNNPTPGSQLILNTADASNPLQLWQPIWYPGTQACVLYHPQTRLYAAPNSLDKGAPVSLSNLPSGLAFNGARTWQIVSGGPFVVRPPDNTDLNLNAFGDSWGPGTKVGVWSWAGGDKNELWSFRLLAQN